MKRLVLPFALLVLLLAACSKAQPEGTAASPTEHADEQHTADPAAECADLKGTPPAEIVMQDNSFEPVCAIVSADQSLSLRNDGAALHSYTVSDSDVDLDVAAGETTNTEAIGGILEPGEYTVHCKYHAEMTGELHVE